MVDATVGPSRCKIGVKHDCRTLNIQRMPRSYYGTRAWRSASSQGAVVCRAARRASKHPSIVNEE
eukprot:5405159-Prymnesium_polylepis.1